MTDVVLHSGRDRSVRRRHPWVLSGAVDRVEGPAGPGDWVRLVSAEGARRYGVIIDDSGAVDPAATDALREKLRAERGETGLFDFGGTIEEIKARCKAETHLDPPVQPTFAQAG